MSQSVSDKIRKEVAARAGYRCEYCLLSEAVAFYVFHVDHIKSIKHGGSNIPENLAYSCPDCNNFKGTDVGTFQEDDENLIRFFNPRKDIWEEHFKIQVGEIVPLTEIGKATEQIYRFNALDRLVFRQQLSSLGQYP